MKIEIGSNLEFLLYVLMTLYVVDTVFRRFI